MHVDKPLREKPLKTAFGIFEKPWKHSKTHRVSFFRLYRNVCGFSRKYCCLIFDLILTPYKLLGLEQTTNLSRLEFIKNRFDKEST